MSWQEFKYVWGFEERPHAEKEVIYSDSADGILAAGNFVYDNRQRNHEYFIVDLPNYEMTVEEKLYAQYLLDHPHKDVEVLYMEKDLWQNNKPLIVPLEYQEKSPVDMNEEEYQEWIDWRRGVV